MKPRDLQVRDTPRAMETGHLHCVKTILRMAGLRPTWQRLLLGGMLFGNGHRHISAEQLFHEASALRSIALATVYNTLNQFQEVGLIRRLSMGVGTAVYDTDTSNHFHLYDERSGQLLDLDPGHMPKDFLPALPDDVVSTVDILVTIRPKATVSRG